MEINSVQWETEKKFLELTELITFKPQKDFAHY